MKLYTTPGGTWAGTEKDWIKAMKAEGQDPKTASRKTIEVPTSKAELMEWLTFYDVRCIERPSASHAVAPQAAPPAPQAPVGDTGASTLPDLDTLFAAAPLRKQLRLAVTAIDMADAQVHGG